MSTKGVVIGCGGALVGVALLIGLIVGVVFWATGDAVKAADAFLSLLGEQKVAEAFAQADPALRSQQSEEQFADAVAALGLTEFDSVSWHNRSVENNQATLEGTVTTRTGGSVPLTIELLHNDGVWRVLSLHGPRAGATVEMGGKKVPADEQLNRLAGGTLADFNRALNARDFADFHKSISKLWQNQITPDGLREAFTPLIDANVNLDGIEGVDPVFDEPPAIDAEGLLVLSGYYPADAKRVNFRLKYTYEHPAWKLLGIEVNVGPAASGTPAELPSEAGLAKLATDTLLEFNKAIQSADFTQFHAGAATAFREQVSVKTLENAFRSFIDQKIDIGSIADSAPVFAAPPKASEDGTLKLAGHYPTTPEVAFELDYFSESGEWKLTSIDVKVR